MNGKAEAVGAGVRRRLPMSGRQNEQEEQTRDEQDERADRRQRDRERLRGDRRVPLQSTVR